MSQFFQIHPENPQHRLIYRAADILREGGVVAYPTDSAYAIGCHIGDKAAIDLDQPESDTGEGPGVLGQPHPRLGYRPQRTWQRGFFS